MRINLIMWEKENHYKAKEIAEKLGITETTYSLIKNGKSNPNIELAYKFQEVFNTDNVLELFKKF